jgi:Sugar phosphate isomerases/epimerases
MTYTLWRELDSGKMDLYSLIDFAQENKFEAIEFSVHIIDRYGVDAVRKALLASDMKVSCINGTFSLASKDDATFNNAVEEAKRMVHNAVDLECSCIMIVPAMVTDIDGAEDKKRAMEMIGKGLEQIVAYAGLYGVTATIEDFPNIIYPLGTIKEIEYLINRVTGLKLTFDNGNFFPSGEDAMEAYEHFSDLIVNVHIKDWEYSQDGVGILCTNGNVIRGASHGKGLMEHRMLLEALESKGYSGYIAFEYEGVLDHIEETRNGARYLQELLTGL